MHSLFLPLAASTCMALMPLCATYGASSDYKTVHKVIQNNQTHMVGDGFKVATYFPSRALSHQDTSPFVLLDYNAPSYFPPTSGFKRGVGPHPHKGFETVTIVYEGSFAHRDSAGHSGVIKAGDVQWMTAGSGVLHEEYQAQEFCEKGGTQHAVQLWVNLPAKYKETAPHYQDFSASQLGIKKEEGVTIRMIAGSYKDVKGPASTFSPLEVFDADIREGATLSFALPASYNTFLLVTKGQVFINKKTAASFKDLVVFKHEGTVIEVVATKEAKILVLSGEPLNEPVIQSGPFVMNTRQEIVQAERDFQAGKFGRLE